MCQVSRGISNFVDKLLCSTFQSRDEFFRAEAHVQNAQRDSEHRNPNNPARAASIEQHPQAAVVCSIHIKFSFVVHVPCHLLEFFEVSVS
jgi:hypothetical protein